MTATVRPLTVSRLTPKQEAFCQHYIRYGSVADAYRSAYDAATARSQTARRNGHKLLTHPRVAARCFPSPCARSGRRGMLPR